MKTQTLVINDDENLKNRTQLEVWMHCRKLSMFQLARKSGVSVTDLAMILGGYSNGTIRTWHLLQAAAGNQHFEYDHDTAGLLPKRGSRGDRYLSQFLIEHLKTYGNVAANGKHIRQFGGIETVLRMLAGYGCDCDYKETEILHGISVNPETDSDHPCDYVIFLKEQDSD